MESFLVLLSSNLFAVFSPQIFWGLSLNWIASFSPLIIIPNSYWVSMTEYELTVKMVAQKLHAEVCQVFGTQKILGSSLFIVSFFLLLVTINFMGMMPYVFTPTSHLVFTLTLSLYFFYGFMYQQILQSSSSFLAHLVPRGTPKVLMNFMVLIELVSLQIRPFTLAVRLVANMVAGHLLLTLVSSPMPSGSYSTLIVLFPALMILVALELGVAVIQSYVFSMLMSLYMKESILTSHKSI